MLADALLAEGVRGHNQVDEVECAATLCRLQARHDSGEAALALVNQVGRNPLFGDSEAFSERFEFEDGSLETITYITRRGHALPRATPPGE